jgi:hypothetical protein
VKSCYSHYVWHAEGGLIRQVLINKPNKKEHVERPKQRWLGGVKDDLKTLINRASIEDAKDREV